MSLISLCFIKEFFEDGLKYATLCCDTEYYNSIFFKKCNKQVLLKIKCSFLLFDAGGWGGLFSLIIMPDLVVQPFLFN